MTLPRSMKAVAISRPGGPEVLALVERPVPGPRDGELLIGVAAASVNGPDVHQREGRYSPPAGASDLPGLDIAGTVVAVGGGTSRFREGDSVCALVAGGGYAEYCTAPAVQCLPIPKGIDLIAAAALPETVFTVWANVFEAGQLQPGETLLVHGGASGIGTTAIALAKPMGARVFATTGSDEKCRACLDLGAERAVNYSKEDFVAELLAATDRRGVDVILDMIGGDYTPRNIQLLAPKGRLVQIAFMHGPRAEVDLSAVMQKRLTITGSLLRPRSVEEKGRLARAIEQRIWPLIESGAFRPVIHATLPLNQARKAHEILASGTHIGKIVLTTGL